MKNAIIAIILLTIFAYVIYVQMTEPNEGQGRKK
jgi:hypothetical protein